MKEQKEKAQRKTKWNRRFCIALTATVVAVNLYVAIDVVTTNRTTKEINQQGKELLGQLKELSVQYTNLNDRRSELNGIYEERIQQLDQSINRLHD